MSFKELVRKDVSSCCKECLVNDKYSGINFGYYDQNLTSRLLEYNFNLI